MSRKQEAFIANDFEMNTISSFSTDASGFRLKKQQKKSYRNYIYIMTLAVLIIVIIHFINIYTSVRSLRKEYEQYLEKSRINDKSIIELKQNIISLEGSNEKLKKDIETLQAAKSSDGYVSSVNELDLMRNNAEIENLNLKIKELNKEIKNEKDLNEFLKIELEDARRHGTYSP